LLTFAKGGEPVKKLVNLGSIISEAVGFAVTGTAVRCDVDIQDGLWSMEADLGQLSQVIHNLIINAVQAMPEGGAVRVRAENLSGQGSGWSQVHISITDSGTGIPEEHLGKIFDPFFTTKNTGSGLGLATCHSIIKKHGGSISVSSREGEGTTFDIYLPALENSRAPEPCTDKALMNGQGLVLVMDDEEDVRHVMSEMLEELGYRVKCAGNGREAVDLYQTARDSGEPFDVVILDLTVPGEIGGKETIALLKEIDSGVRAVVSSGYSTSPILANHQAFGFAGIIRKPCKMDEISKVMHDIMKR
jgi:CheY-like chemotaxis protein